MPYNNGFMDEKTSSEQYSIGWNSLGDKLGDLTGWTPYLPYCDSEDYSFIYNFKLKLFDFTDVLWVILESKFQCKKPN